MTDVCPKCRYETDDLAAHQRGIMCRIASDAYQRGRRDGIDEGVRLAKAHVGTYCPECRWERTGTDEFGPCWSDVEAEAEKAKERAR